MLFFVCSEVAESKLVKPETSRTVILLPTVSVPWSSVRCFKTFLRGNLEYLDSPFGETAKIGYCKGN